MSLAALCCNFARKFIPRAQDLKLLNGRGKLLALYIPLCIIRILNALTSLFARESVTDLDFDKFGALSTELPSRYQPRNGSNGNIIIVKD